MEHLNKLLLLTQDYQGLLFIFGIAITFLESFIPALPLIGIVITNSVLLGFLRGITASIIGSCLGTLILFLFANKFRNLKYFKKLKNDKTNKISKWIDKQNYIVIFLCYSNPFLPSCLITASLGFLGKSLNNFIPGMVLGKTAMFSVASYLGHDIHNLIHNPSKILIVLVMLAISFFIGKKLSKSIK